eukprot:COSAG01_NODE_531_length_15849_cov_29.199556_4_plen_112_part_00
MNIPAGVGGRCLSRCCPPIGCSPRQSLVCCSPRRLKSLICADPVVFSGAHRCSLSNKHTVSLSLLVLPSSFLSLSIFPLAEAIGLALVLVPTLPLSALVLVLVLVLPTRTR